MKIVIINFKGGVGKSLIAHQLICCFDFYGVELDFYGNLEMRLPGKAIKIKNKLPDNLPENVVFDCGAFNTKIDIDVINISDCLIIPFNTSFESVQTTILTLNTLNTHLVNKKILFIANQTKKNNMLKEAFQAFEKILGKKLNVFHIPDLQSFQTAINANVGVTKLAVNNKIYRKAGDVFNSLLDTIYAL